MLSCVNEGFWPDAFLKMKPNFLKKVKCFHRNKLLHESWWLGLAIRKSFQHQNIFRNLFAHKQSLLLTTTTTLTHWTPGRSLSSALHRRPLRKNPKLMPAHCHLSGWEQLLFVSFCHVTLCLSNRKGLSVWPQLEKAGTVLCQWAPGKDQQKCWCSRQPKQREAVHVRQGAPIILLSSETESGKGSALAFPQSFILAVYNTDNVTSYVCCSTKLAARGPVSTWTASPGASPSLWWTHHNSSCDHPCNTPTDTGKSFCPCFADEKQR